MSDARPPEGAVPRVRRLIDMLVREVSLVDRAANKRRFLVVKKEFDMPKTEAGRPRKLSIRATAKQAEGTAAPPSAAASGSPKDSASAGEPSQAGGAPPAAAPNGSGAVKPAGAPPPPAASAAATTKAKGGKKPPPPPPEAADEEEEEEEPGTTPRAKDLGGMPSAPALGGGDPDDESPDQETPLTVALAALDSLTKAVEMLSDSPEDGAELAGVAEEIRAAADAISAAAGIASDDTLNTPPAGEASLDSLVSSIQEMLVKVESLTEALGASATTSTPPGTPTITEEMGAPPDLAGTLEQVTQSLKSIGDVVKEQSGRLSAIEKRFGVPNSQPVGERVEKAAKPFSWPLDLNRPRNRESAAPGTRFSDD